MKSIKFLALIIMASLSLTVFAQKKDCIDADMYNKNEQYEKAMQSIEKCINHEHFYGMSNYDQAIAWLYRAKIYYNVSTMSNASLICPNALSMASESLRKCKQTDAEVSNENRDWIQSVESYIANVQSSNTASNSVNQTSQWEFFNTISNYNEISLRFGEEDAWETWSTSTYEGGTKNGKKRKGAFLSMSLHDDYSVTLDYSNPMVLQYVSGGEFCSTNVPFVISGQGLLSWENEHMVLRIEIVAESPGRNVYEGGPFRQYTHTSSVDLTRTYVYDVEYKEEGESGCFVFVGNDIEVTRKSWYSRTTTSGNPVIGDEIFYVDKLCISGTHNIKNKKQKSQSEMNAQNSDMYGKWQWNNDRSVIYLESTTKNATMVIWNHRLETEKCRRELMEYETDTTLDATEKSAITEKCLSFIQRYKDNPIVWGFKLYGGTGYKTDKADTGDDLTYLMITFDGSAEQSFSFANTSEKGIDGAYEHVQYDRFFGTLKRDATILGQIKDKRTMIVNYKQNGQEKTAMFQLEGLEAIYNAITQ